MTCWWMHLMPFERIRKCWSFASTFKIWLFLFQLHWQNGPCLGFCKSNLTPFFQLIFMRFWNIQEAVRIAIANLMTRMTFVSVYWAAAVRGWGTHSLRDKLCFLQWQSTTSVRIKRQVGDDLETHNTRRLHWWVSCQWIESKNWRRPKWLALQNCTIGIYN